MAIFPPLQVMLVATEMGYFFDQNTTGKFISADIAPAVIGEQWFG